MKMVKVRANRPLPQLAFGQVGEVEYAGNVPAMIANGLLELVGPHPHAVPEGTVSFVLNWVGDDVGRATMAYDVEMAKASPRVSLVRRLSALMGLGADMGPDPYADTSEAPSARVDDYSAPTGD